MIADFPQGTLRMQMPFILSRGLDLSTFYNGTVNVSIAPHRYQVLKSRHTFTNVKWHPDVPAETFSFFNVRLVGRGTQPVQGLVYYPHPETKPEHFQKPDVLELLLPYIEGLKQDSILRLALARDQLQITSPL